MEEDGGVIKIGGGGCRFVATGSSTFSKFSIEDSKNFMKDKRSEDWAEWTALSEALVLIEVTPRAIGFTIPATIGTLIDKIKER